MDWIHDFQLFLFDLDGLLVNTEHLHFCAYQKMLQNRGFELPWGFERYCQTAHYHSDKIASELYEIFPDLHLQEPSWDNLYVEKKEMMLSLLNEGLVELMPGVSHFLNLLKKAGVKICVVTHSPDELVTVIRKQQPLLNEIPFWITRHDYDEPKPNPECYLKAISQYAQPHDKVIGFEDSPRGLKALMGTKATAVLISEVAYPEIAEFVEQGALHYPTFCHLPQKALETAQCEG